jgi:hypothetical protein
MKTKFCCFKKNYLGNVSSFNSSENNIISAEAVKVLPVVPTACFEK